VIGGIRRFFNMVFRRDYFRFVHHWGSRHDYSGEVGDGTGSSTVMAPVLWTATTFPEAPPCLWQKLDTGQEEPVRDHEMLRLLERPNPFYTGPILWMATIADYKVNGNGYWIKEWNRAGTRPVRLWFTPSWMIEPRGSETDTSVFVEHYEYTVDGELFKLDPRDVVHFRFGLDPVNPRKGFSPLKTVLREVYTDDEAARFTASLLRNMGVPGLIISPDTDSPITESEATEAKRYFNEQFSGDKRGEPIVMTGRTKLEQFGFSPEQLLLRELRRIPEERVTAVLGVPAIVAGLGAGLDRSTFTNMAEAREAAYESGIIPTQRIIAEDIRFQLLPDFEADVHPWRFGFDLSKVRVLQEDLYRQAQRNDLAYRGGWATRGEARRPMGLPVNAGDDVYQVPLNIALVPANGEGAAQTYTAPTNGNGNGSGAVAIAEEVIRAMERERLRTGATP
jgi:HK97 family phage portal protein